MASSVRGASIGQMQGTLASFTAPFPLPTLALWDTSSHLGLGGCVFFHTIPFLPDLFVLWSRDLLLMASEGLCDSPLDFLVECGLCAFIVSLL